MDGVGRGRLAGRALHGLIALAVSAALLGLLAIGYGPIPALGRALDPGHGAWASAAGLPASAAAAIAVTLLVAAIQAIVGLWLGRALAPGHG